MEAEYGVGITNRYAYFCGWEDKQEEEVISPVIRTKKTAAAVANSQPKGQQQKVLKKVDQTTTTTTAKPKQDSKQSAPSKNGNGKARSQIIGKDQHGEPNNNRFASEDNQNVKPENSRNKRDSSDDTDNRYRQQQTGHRSRIFRRSSNTQQQQNDYQNNEGYGYYQRLRRYAESSDDTKINGHGGGYSRGRGGRYEKDGRDDNSGYSGYNNRKQYNDDHQNGTGYNGERRYNNGPRRQNDGNYRNTRSNEYHQGEGERNGGKHYEGSHQQRNKSKQEADDKTGENGDTTQKEGNSNNVKDPNPEGNAVSQDQGESQPVEGGDKTEEAGDKNIDSDSPPSEPEPVTFTLKEWKAIQAQAPRETPVFNIRKPGEGESKLGKLVPKKKDDVIVDEEEDGEVEEIYYPQRAGKMKVVSDVGFTFEKSHREIRERRMLNQNRRYSPGEERVKHSGGEGDGLPTSSDQKETNNGNHQPRTQNRTGLNGQRDRNNFRYKKRSPPAPKIDDTSVFPTLR